MMAFLAGGLFLSFSRGAWFHFGLSAVIAIATLYAASPDPRMRTRIVVFGVVAAIGIALLVIALTSIGSVHDMFLERAKAIQPYDVGPGGRFWLQATGAQRHSRTPQRPGTASSASSIGGQQHNVYMQGFLVYGWLGGAAYLALVALTLV